MECLTSFLSKGIINVQAFPRNVIHFIPGAIQPVLRIIMEKGVLAHCFICPVALQIMRFLASKSVFDTHMALDDKKWKKNWK